MEINNVAYSWSMVQITCDKFAKGTNPEVLLGVSAVKWNRKRNIKTNYGLGGEPVTRGFGNREYTASITMDYNTQTRLRTEAGVGSLTDLGEFDLIISWSNELNTSKITTETVTLRGCVFDEDGMDIKQDDTNVTKEFNLNPIAIVTQAVPK